MNADDDRTWLLQLLERYGRNLHSFMVLEPGLTIWQAEDAAVAYTQRGGYWVAVGGPLCAPEQSLKVARAFSQAAAQARCRVVFFGVTQPLVDRLAGSEFDALQIGQAPLWDPQQWPKVIKSARKLRNRLSKASRDGLSVRILSADEIQSDSPLRARLIEIVDAWTGSKALPPMGFMVTLELFQHPSRRRYFVVQQQQTVYGLAVCIPIYGRKGWLLEDMILAPDAPAGSSEALVDQVMRQLAREDAHCVSLGLVALAGLGNSPSASRHPWLSAMLRTCCSTMGWLYNFEGLYRFRSKLQPSSWEPVYLIASPRVSFLTIRAVLMAFAQGWVPRFGLRVLGHWFHRVWPKPDNRSKPKLDVFIAALALVSLLAMFIAVIGAYAHWLPGWLSLLVGTLAAYVGFTPIHEAVHGNVSRYRIVNELCGHACSALLAGAYKPYCYLHSQHHLHTNVTSSDPDSWCAVGPRWTWPIRWATQDIGYLCYYLANWTERPWTERANLLTCACAYGVVFVGTLWWWPALFIALCLGWIVPARVALFLLAATFSWLPHAPHKEHSAFRATSVNSAPWLTWALLGQNFHLVHHLEPWIPFHRLSATWARRRQEWLERGAVDYHLSTTERDGD